MGLQSRVPPAERDAIFSLEVSVTVSLPSPSALVSRGIPSGRGLPGRGLERLDSLLRKRWVQSCLFVGSFLVFWLLGSGVAHS